MPTVSTPPRLVHVLAASGLTPTTHLCDFALMGGHVQPTHHFKLTLPSDRVIYVTTDAAAKVIPDLATRLRAGVNHGYCGSAEFTADELVTLVELASPTKSRGHYRELLGW